MSNQAQWVEFEKDRDVYNISQHGTAWGISGGYGRKRWSDHFLSWPLRWKWFLQRRERGYDDREIWELRRSIVEFIYPRLKHYVTWQAEHGRSQPVDFDKDPAKWLDALNKMLHAFELLARDENLFGMRPHSVAPLKKGEEAASDAHLNAVHRYSAEHNREIGEIQEGMELFSTYFRSLKE